MYIGISTLAWQHSINRRVAAPNAEYHHAVPTHSLASAMRCQRAQRLPKLQMQPDTRTPKTMQMRGPSLIALGNDTSSC